MHYAIDWLQTEVINDLNLIEIDAKNVLNITSLLNEVNYIHV